MEGPKYQPQASKHVSMHIYLHICVFTYMNTQEYIPPTYIWKEENDKKQFCYEKS